MEQELDTNDIKEKLVQWKTKSFDLKDKLNRCKKEIKNLDKLPEPLELLTYIYPLVFFGVTMFFLFPEIIILLEQKLNSNIYEFY